MGMRASDPTARPRRRPSRTNGNAVATDANYTDTSPQTTAVSAGPPPLYGTLDHVYPGCDLGHPAARKVDVPTPAEE